VIKAKWLDTVIEKDKAGTTRINRINYEISVLHALRERLRSKEVWVVDAFRYRNPDEDLPQDFVEKRSIYYGDLNYPRFRSLYCQAKSHAGNTARPDE
jgi:hypothetical protein